MDSTIQPPTWLEHTVNAPSRELLIENLKFFTSYSVRIAAETIKGRGNHSELSEYSKMATLEDSKLKRIKKTTLVYRFKPWDFHDLPGFWQCG